MSIPERIAKGDLDGDLYLICWDDVILSYMKAAPLEDREMEDDGILKTTGHPNANWLIEAQDLMMDAGKLNQMGKLTGKVYRLGEKMADSSDEGLKNADSAAMFEAYTQSLEYKKHGCEIRLPLHLHKKVDKKLRHLLVDTG